MSIEPDEEDPQNFPVIVGHKNIENGTELSESLEVTLTQANIKITSEKADWKNASPVLYLAVVKTYYLLLRGSSKIKMQKNIDLYTIISHKTILAFSYFSFPNINLPISLRLQ